MKVLNVWSIVLVLIFFGLQGCKSQLTESEVEKSTTQEFLGLEYKNKWKSQSEAITLMTFNVENLFDTNDDPGKSDETYLPIEKKKSSSHKKKCSAVSNPKWRKQCLTWDWNETVLAYKLKVTARAILQAKGGKGPDILVLQEVENLEILKALNAQGLNYPTTLLIEGKDKRGIDIAIMSRLKLKNPASLHAIKFSGISKKSVADTRGILQADLALPGGETLTVLGVHFPAPFQPVKMRVQAFKTLNQIKRSLPKDRLVMAAGDFNVPKPEDLKMNLVANATGKDWYAGHKIACQSCPGSTYYKPKDSWSFLDMIFWSKSFDRSDWKILLESMRVLNAALDQKSQSGAPKRFDISGPSGVSDHWPLAVDLVRQEP